MTTTTVRKWGDSLAVRLPAELTKRSQFEEGTEVEMFVTERNEIVIRPALPVADDQEALRAHFLALREKCKPGMKSQEEVFAEPMGMKSFNDDNRKRSTRQYCMASASSASWA